jgi:hypothetical protein
MCVHLAPKAAVGSDAISAAASAAVRDWLETQARVVEYWRDLLADSGAAEEMVAALDAHAAFLNGMTMRS